MTLTFPASGTLTTTVSEADVFTQVIVTGLHACKIHLDLMQAGDTFVIRVYNYDDADSVERLFGIYTYSDIQAEPTTYFDFIPSTRYRITIQRTGGVDREISWGRMLII